MTAQQEDTIIHEFLAQFMMSLDHPRQVSDIAERYGISNHASVLLDRLLEEGLVTKVSPDYGYFLVKPTPFGVSTIRHNGGYLGYKAEVISKQQQAQAAQLEKDNLEREAALATVSAAKSSASATIAAWVSATVAVVAIAISFLLNNSLDKTNAQLEMLTKRVHALEAQTQQQRQHPERP